MRRTICILGVALAAAVASLHSFPSGESSLGEFATSLEGRTKNQAHNATLAMSRLKNVVIKPGEVFSFNTTVGTYSVDQGFRKAPVSYNGQLLDGWGGGVCQTSSTVYNAALLAGLEIEDRSKHRYAPSYVPPGRDAAVAYPNIDLKIRNPYTFAITLKGRWEGKRLVAGFYGLGKKLGDVSLVTRVIDVQQPGSVALTRRSAQARTRNTGKSGFEVATYRLVDGRRELVSRDSYPAMTKVIEYGE